MPYDPLPTVYSILSDNWPDFEFKKSKKTWVKETADRILLLIQCQGSRWASMYYLNFGTYFLDIEPVNKPISNLPKSNDWHLFSRYESFEQLSAIEQKNLFSLEESDSTSLEDRCMKIASFSKINIIPQLESFGDINVISKNIFKEGVEVFKPYWIQKISDETITNYFRKDVI